MTATGWIGRSPANPPISAGTCCASNAADGTTLWQKTVKIDAEVPRAIAQIQRHGYASATPAADAETVYTLFERGIVTAWDFDGKQKWTRDLKFRLHGWGTGASPVLAGDVVILTESMDDGVFAALSKKDGSEVWRQPAPPTPGTPRCC